MEWKQTQDDKGNMVSVKHGQGVEKDQNGKLIRQGQWNNGQFVQNIESTQND